MSRYTRLPLLATLLIMSAAAHRAEPDRWPAYAKLKDAARKVRLMASTVAALRSSLPQGGWAASASDDPATSQIVARKALHLLETRTLALDEVFSHETQAAARIKHRLCLSVTDSSDSSTPARRDLQVTVVETKVVRSAGDEEALYTSMSFALLGVRGIRLHRNSHAVQIGTAFSCERKLKTSPVPGRGRPQIDPPRFRSKMEVEGIGASVMHGAEQDERTSMQLLQPLPSLPTSFDWRRELHGACRNQIEMLYDQGECGSCYGHAVVSACADRSCIAAVREQTFRDEDEDTDEEQEQERGWTARRLSVQDLLSCGTMKHGEICMNQLHTDGTVMTETRFADNCDGGYALKAHEYAAAHGLVDASCAPIAEGLNEVHASDHTEAEARAALRRNPTTRKSGHRRRVDEEEEEAEEEEEDNANLASNVERVCLIQLRSRLARQDTLQVGCALLFHVLSAKDHQQLVRASKSDFCECPHADRWWRQNGVVVQGWRTAAEDKRTGTGTGTGGNDDDNIAPFEIRSSYGSGKLCFFEPLDEDAARDGVTLTCRTRERPQTQAGSERPGRRLRVDLPPNFGRGSFGAIHDATGMMGPGGEWCRCTEDEREGDGWDRVRLWEEGHGALRQMCARKRMSRACLNEKLRFHQPTLVAPTEESVMRAIWQHGSVTAGVSVHRDFPSFVEEDDETVYVPAQSHANVVLGAHAIVLFGWGVTSHGKFWWARNSWPNFPSSLRNGHSVTPGIFKLVRGTGYAEGRVTFSLPGRPRQTRTFQEDEEEEEEEATWVPVNCRHGSDRLSARCLVSTNLAIAAGERRVHPESGEMIHGPAAACRIENTCKYDVRVDVIQSNSLFLHGSGKDGGRECRRDGMGRSIDFVVHAGKSHELEQRSDCCVSFSRLSSDDPPTCLGRTVASTATARGANPRDRPCQLINDCDHAVEIFFDPGPGFARIWATVDEGSRKNVRLGFCGEKCRVSVSISPPSISPPAYEEQEERPPPPGYND